jgi:hypothetical protein
LKAKQREKQEAMCKEDMQRLAIEIEMPRVVLHLMMARIRRRKHPAFYIIPIMTSSVDVVFSV